MSLRYRCLILDHDDTAVNSSREIHYPAHCEVIKTLRPHLKPVGFEGWMLKNFHPGIMGYYRGELGMDDAEIQKEYEIWRRFTTTRIPRFFPGFRDVLERFKRKGGIITVVSHSEKPLILRDYGSDADGHTVMPDMVFGWDFDDAKRKPSPWPVNQIINRFELKPAEILILDDLKPGVEMGKKTGVDVAGAGWGYDIPQIRTYMEDHCLAYFTDVSDFNRFLLD